MSQRAKASKIELLLGLKRQLQKVLFNQQQLLETLEKNNLVPEYDEKKPKIIDSKNVDESKKILQGEYKKLENFEVVLAVVGTMKAGKSTTINAIVGREILPNRNRPMTSLPTLIAHKKDQIEPILSFQAEKINQYIQKLRNYDKLAEYLEHKDVKSYGELIALINAIKNGRYKFETLYKGEKQIFNFLAGLNDLVRVARLIAKDDLSNAAIKFPFAEYKEVTALPRIEVEFTELAQQDEQIGNLVLLDTPGPNEADLPELQDILEQQLKRSSAVMVVMDYSQLKSQADADIRQELKKLPKIEQERLFALVNKFDQKTAHGDDEKTTKNIIANDLLKDQIKLENVYCLSAQDAFLGNRLISYIQQHHNKPDFDKEAWVQDFAKKAFGTRAKTMYDSADCQELIEDSKNMVKDSKIALPLNNVILASYKNAPQIAMQSALKDVDSIFTNITNVFEIKEYFMDKVSLNDNEITQIQNTIEQLKRNIEALKKTTEQAKEELEIISKQSIDEFNKEFDAIEEQSADYLWSKILLQIKSFKESKQQELDKQERLFTFSRNYRQERKELRQQLEDLERSIMEKGQLSLRQNEMEKLSKIMENQHKEINEPLVAAIRNKLKQIAQGINDKIAQQNTAIVSNMNDIQMTFGKEGIKIQLSKLNIADIHLSENIGVNIFNLSTQRLESDSYTTNKIKRWFGGLFGQDDWGRKSYTITYCDVSLEALKTEVKKLSIQGILEPAQKKVTQSLEHFIKHIATDVHFVELEAEKLKNELEIALADEYIPSLELKQQRKAVLRLISLENQQVQQNVELVKNSLHTVFTGAIS